MENENGFYDISPEVSFRTAVFPGDVPFRRTVHLDFQKGDHLLLSSIETTLHIGAHADAPNHYHPEGKGIGSVSLEPYLGSCQVISVTTPKAKRIRPEDLEGRAIFAPRVLFKTKSFPDPNRWSGGFTSLSPELIHDLATKGAKLVGIDSPSIDPEESKALESHQAVYRTGIAVLEGLVLDDVPDGVYTLVALPLKIKDADAAPVRAVLIKGVTYFATEFAGLKMRKVNQELLKADPAGSPHFFIGENNCELYFLEKSGKVVQFHISFFGNYIEGDPIGKVKVGWIEEESLPEKPSFKRSTLVSSGARLSPELTQSVLTFIWNIPGLLPAFRDEIAAMLKRA